MAASEKARLALYDFDGTMLPGDSIALYAWFAVKRGDMPLPLFFHACLGALGYGLGRVSAEESKNRALSFQIGWSEKRKQEFNEAFVQKVLLKKIYPKALAQLNRDREEGFLPLLVSASTENYMALAGKTLGFYDVIATRLVDGRVSGNCRGEEKVRRIYEWLSQRQIEADFSLSRAYGDSRGDLPMLRLCGFPTQVNPKEKLRKAAGSMAVADWKK